MNDYIFVVRKAEVRAYQMKKTRAAYAFHFFYQKMDRDRGYEIATADDIARLWDLFDGDSGVKSTEEICCCMLVAPGQESLAEALKQAARQHQPPYRMMTGRDNAWDDAGLRAFAEQVLREPPKDIRADAVQTEAQAWHLLGLPDGLELKHVSTFQIKARKPAETKSSGMPNVKAGMPKPPGERDRPRVVQRPANVVPPKAASAKRKPASARRTSPSQPAAENRSAFAADFEKQQKKEQLPPCPPEVLNAFIKKQTEEHCEEVDLS